MKEVTQLREQLYDLVEGLSTAEEEEGQGGSSSGSMDAIEVAGGGKSKGKDKGSKTAVALADLKPPTLQQQDVLRQLIVGAFIDSVAMRAPPEVAAEHSYVAKGRAVS